jgi:Rod binding domain-containing protein
MLRMSTIFPTDLVLGVMHAAQPQRAAAAAARLSAPSHDVNQKFEAVMLRRMVEEMLPKDSSSLYGEGTAGDIWRSLQADLMSQEMAKGGGVGLAKLLDKAQDRLGQQDSGSLNSIAPRLNAPQVTTAEWPYFKHARLMDKPT